MRRFSTFFTGQRVRAVDGPQKGQKGQVVRLVFHGEDIGFVAVGAVVKFGDDIAYLPTSQLAE